MCGYVVSTVCGICASTIRDTNWALQESGYKMAVILTNEVGPSHRSRSSMEMRTAVSEMIEFMWISVTTVCWGMLLMVYGYSCYHAPRVDALFTDTESEEEANNSLLRCGCSVHVGGVGVDVCVLGCVWVYA